MITAAADRVAGAARAAWAAIEAVEKLTAEDLQDPGVESIAEQLWTVADQLEGRIEAARSVA